MAGTVTSTVDNVALTFWFIDRKDPCLNEDGRTSHLLQPQCRSYKNQDGQTKQQKAITATLLRVLANLRATVKDVATSQLTVGAWFFTMRSCECAKVTGERRTKLLCVKSIRFFKGNHEKSHSDPDLALADTASITFEHQKNDERCETVTMFRTRDNLLCPVRAWAAIVR